MSYSDDLASISPEQLAEIQRCRQRSDKIASLMGQYLLKGWRMLNEFCSSCNAVLLMNPDGELYCVGCSEVDKETKVNNTPDNHRISTANTPSGDALPQSHCAPMKLGHLIQKNQKAPLSPSVLDGDSENNIEACHAKLQYCINQLSLATAAEDIQRWAHATKTLADTTVSLQSYYSK